MGRELSRGLSFPTGTNLPTTVHNLPHTLSPQEDPIALGSGTTVLPHLLVLLHTQPLSLNSAQSSMTKVRATPFFCPSQNYYSFPPTPGLFSWDRVTMPMEFFPRSANSLEQTPLSFCNFVLSEPPLPTPHYHACMYVVSELQSLRLVQCLCFPLTLQVYADREAFLVALLQVMTQGSRLFSS